MDPRPFQAALDQAKATLADKQAHSAAPSEIAAAQAAVKAAQGNLAATRIVAPVGGIAGRAVPGLGDLLHPGAPLTSIFTVDPIKAVFTLPKKFYEDTAEPIEQVLALPPEGRPETLELVLAEGKPYPHRGKWDSVDHPGGSLAGPAAYALFPNPDGVLRPGEYVKIRVAKP